MSNGMTDTQRRQRLLGMDHLHRDPALDNNDDIYVTWGVRPDANDPSHWDTSLPVAGQARTDGLSTYKIPMKGFKIASLHLNPLLPSFARRNRGDMCELANPCSAPQQG
jgi:hypothetical protein